MKLHEAMIKVLKESSKECMTSREIADEINRQKLYERGDKCIIPTSQISARVNKYPHLFIINPLSILIISIYKILILKSI